MSCEVKKVKDQHYFIGSVECHQVKYCSGDIATKEGTRVYLANNEDDYADCSTLRADALHFKSKEEIIEKWQRWNGMPWWYEFKPDTLIVEEINACTVTTYDEEIKQVYP